MGVSAMWNVPVPGSIGPDKIELFDDFTLSASAPSTALGGWRSTNSTMALGDEVGGVAVLTPAAAAVGCFQTNHDSFSMPIRGKKLWFECRFKPALALNTGFWVGLSNDDQEPTGGVTNGLAFTKTDSATLNINVEVTTASSAVVTDTGSDYANTTYVVVGFEVIGEDRVNFYLNGVKVHTTTTMPAVGTTLRPNIGQALDAAGTSLLTVDYIRVVQNR